MNVETKERSKQWMHTHSRNKPKIFKQTSATKLMGIVFTVLGYSEQKEWHADIQYTCSAPQ
jgi:hypothetical protein